MIVLTAPTGRIGAQVLDRLLEQDEAVRVIARDPERLAPQVRERIDVIAGSHRDRDVVDAAFAGADSVFWLVPADPRAASPYEAYVGFSIPAADAVVRHGVPRLVTISALGRGRQIYGGHVSASLAMEDLFRSTGAHVRALTMPTFMDMMLYQVASLKDSGVINGTLPADLSAPSVATRDIAEVAAAFLVDHTWEGQDSQAVLGPENLSFEDMAAVLTDVLDRPVAYEEGSRDQAKQAFVSRGYSEAMAQSMMDMDLAKERGIDDSPARTPQSSTPTTFRAWATEVLVPAYRAL